MTQDRPLLGIALMLCFCALAPVADALAKILGPQLGLAQIITLRFAFQALILLPIVVVGGRHWRLSRAEAGWIALRTLLHIAGIGCMVAALIHLPLADAVAIAFVMPFFALLLGHWFLGEEVGWRRIAACVVGFVGTLMVVQPAFEDVGWPALLPMAVALIFAVFMLVTRKIAGATDPISMQAISAVMALGLMVPLHVLAPTTLPGLAWISPAPALWWTMAAMGVAGTLAHLMMTWSLRYTPAATLAPMQYLEIPVATLVGYLVFAELPGVRASAGIAITICAGVYVILRERAMSRALPPAPHASSAGSSAAE